MASRVSRALPAASTGLRPLLRGAHNLDPVEVVYFEDQGGVPLMRGREVVKRPADPAEWTRLYTAEAIDFIEANQKVA